MKIGDKLFPGINHYVVKLSTEIKDKEFKKNREENWEEIRTVSSLTLCPHCGKISYGWGYKCRYCMKDIRINKIEVLYEGRDYEGGNE